jgi:hypothetical protein
MSDKKYRDDEANDARTDTQDSQYDFFLFPSGKQAEVLDFVFQVKNAGYDKRRKSLDPDVADPSMERRHFFQPGRGMAQIKGGVPVYAGIVRICNKAVTAGAFDAYCSLVDGETDLRFTFGTDFDQVHGAIVNL